MATKEQIEYPVCDECLEAAADLGAEDKEMQETLCREIGSDLVDHICVTFEDDDRNVICECQCSRNKPQHPQYAEDVLYISEAEHNVLRTLGIL